MNKIKNDNWLSDKDREELRALAEEVRKLHSSDRSEARFIVEKRVCSNGPRAWKKLFGSYEWKEIDFCETKSQAEVRAIYEQCHEPGAVLRISMINAKEVTK